MMRLKTRLDFLSMNIILATKIYIRINNNNVAIIILKV